MDKTEILFHTPGATDAVFPYVVVAGGTTLTTAREPPVMRRFNQHLLILTLHGAGTIRVGGRQRLTGPETLAWLDTARDYAHGCAPGQREWHYLWLGLHGFGLAEIFSRIRADQDPLTRLLAPHAARDAMRAILHRLRHRSAGLEAGNSADVAALLASLLADRRPTAEADLLAEPRLDQLRARLRGTLAQSWTIETIAEAAALSPSQLFRSFKASTSQTPMAWLKNERINAAKPLLLEGGNAVRTVAEAVGYADPFHFSRDFRAIVGRSPRAFRNSGGA
jgi:AraC family transcriptional regulator of arabinose operon